VTLTRREFLNRSGITGGSSALSALIAFGADQDSVRTATVPQAWKIRETTVVPSVCPYCAVGCGLLLHVRDGALVNVEGNPDSPINRGNLCPKGAAVFQLHVNPNRLTRVLYRRPGGTQWEIVDLNWAMDRVAELVKRTRDETFVERGPDGKTLMMTPGIFSLGGALLDDEWNHIHQKLMRGLGIAAIENQARI